MVFVAQNYLGHCRSPDSRLPQAESWNAIFTNNVSSCSLSISLSSLSVCVCVCVCVSCLCSPCQTSSSLSYTSSPYFSRFGLTNVDYVSRSITIGLLLLKRVLTITVGDDLFRPATADRIPALAEDTIHEDVGLVADTTGFSVQRRHHRDFQLKQWSSYYHDTVAKSLVACTAAGRVSFVSRAYGGVTSDEQVAKHSGFYDTVLQDEVILYDKGGNDTMANAVAAKGGKLVMPSIVVQQHLTLSESDFSLGVARGRIVIEHVNERYTYVHTHTHTHTCTHTHAHTHAHTHTHTCTHMHTHAHMHMHVVTHWHLFFRRLKRFDILTTRIHAALFDSLDDIILVCTLLTSFMGPMRKSQAQPSGVQP